MGLDHLWPTSSKCIPLFQASRPHEAHKMLRPIWPTVCKERSMTEPFFIAMGCPAGFEIKKQLIKRCVAPFGSSLFRPTSSFALQSHFHTLDARRGRRINVVICSLNPSPFLFKHSLRNNLRLPHTFPHCQSTSSDYWCHHGRAWFAGRERIVEIASGGRKDRGPETWSRNEKR